MMSKGARLAVVLVMALAGGCPAEEEGELSGGEVPRELTGAWYAGTVSDTHIIDGGGHFTNAYGTGLIYAFHADGSYEKSVLLQQSDGFCQRQFLGYSRGVVRLLDDDTVELRPARGRIKSVDSCLAHYNYERDDDELRDETLTWRRADDGAGAAVLLNDPTTRPTLFRLAR
jgi:hypothetical protein